MAITRIKSNASSFIQPEIGSVVNVFADPMIDWIKVGGKVMIENAGIYKVISVSSFTWELELLTAKVQPGMTVTTGMIMPVQDSSVESVWGGNGKEW